ncbi:MAG TPA: putative quinol monooxygenase [Alphaproteobacteria bacterium]
MTNRTVPNPTARTDAGGPGDGKRVVFIVSIDVKPGCEAEFLRLVTPVLDAMRHETTFVNAVLHQDPQDPTRFMLYETWADMDDVVQVQIHRDYRRPYLDGLSRILREPRQVRIWRPLRGDFTFFAARTAAGDG